MFRRIIISDVLHGESRGSTIMVSMYRTVLTYIIGSLIVGALIFGARRILNPTHIYTRTITSDVVQVILVGVGLAFVTLLIIGNAYVTKVNG